MAEKPGIPFEVHVDRGDATGKTWHGEFRAKNVLSFGDNIRVDRIRREMLGPGPYDGADAEVFAQASILAELAVRITDAPEWWAGGANHADENLLQEVYRQAMKVQADHFAEVKKQGEEAQKKLREQQSK